MLPPGCLNNLYNSVQNLGLESFRTEECKRMLLCPRSVHAAVFKDLKLNVDLTGPTEYYICINSECIERDGWFSYYDTQRCRCGKLINGKVSESWVFGRTKDETEGVLYKGKSIFLVSDDLRVMPGLPGDLIQVLLNMGFQNVSQIEEKVVEFGSEEMIVLLIHSFFSKATLTDVFLKNQGNRPTSPMLDEQFSFIVPNEMESAEEVGKTSVKMLLRKSDRKVLYAEASENFVDLLFSFLTFPLESVLELVLGTKGKLSLGSISNLFRDLNTIFSVSKQSNSKMGVLPPFYSCPKEFPNFCSQDPLNISLDGLAKFESKTPSGLRREPLDPKSPKLCSSNSSGYVEKDLFLVTDDLVVKQLSSISSISFLKETGIQLDDVQHKVISIGEFEAIALLWATLWSSSPLSASLNSFSKKPKQEPL